MDETRLDIAGARRIVQKVKALVAGIENYDDAALTQKVEALKQRLDTLVGSGDASAVIDTFNEIEAFLQGVTNTQTLTGLLQEMKAEIIALIPTSYWHAGNDGAGSGLDADMLDGTHKNGLLTAVKMSGTINRQLDVAVGGTKKSVNIYPDSSFGTCVITKPDNGDRDALILISDITAWKGSTAHSGSFGFTGRIIESRASGLARERITDVICRVSYIDVNAANEDGKCLLATSNSGQVLPVIVKRGNNYYLGLRLSGPGHNGTMQGYFHSCLTEFEALLYDASGNLPAGVSILSDYPTKTITYNVSSADNATLWDGEQRSNYNLFKTYALRLTSLSSDNFYPVTFDADDKELDCLISSWGGSASLPYNNNHIHFLLTSRGWNDIKRSFVVLSQGNYVDNEITIGAIGCGTKKGEKCVWLRGGISYTILSNFPPSLRTSSYTSTSDEVYSVGSNLDGGTNTSVDTIWKNDGARTGKVVATLDSTVAASGKLNTTQLTNQDLDNYSLQYTANFWGNASNTCANKPSGVTLFNLTTYFLSSWFIQVLFDQEANMYRRYKTGASWSPWRKFQFEEDYPGVFIMYHRKSDNLATLAKPSTWPALQSSGEVADGVAIVEGGKFLVVAPTQSILRWSALALSGGATTTTDRAAALADWEGKQNTRKITGFRVPDSGYDNFVPAAANFCTRYGVDDGAISAFGGNWWLPSLGELMMIFANLDKVNYCLGLISGATLISAGPYWSSTEYDDSKAWLLVMGSGAISPERKVVGLPAVRPVSTFFE